MGQHGLNFPNGMSNEDESSSDLWSDESSDSSDSSDDDMELLLFLQGIEKQAYAVGELWDKTTHELLMDLEDLAADGPRPYNYR